MKKVLLLGVFSAVFLLLGVQVLFAATGTVGPEAIGLFKWIAIATGIGMGVAAIGTGIGQGLGVQGACEGVARNPEASGKILTALILGLAMIESLAIYALVIELILLYANPFMKYVVG
ncbi:MAG: ATP synthase F0 subunit C [Deltaproteobacteria bacterium]|nr:ATP synthase F0 subunit C [Deltaproteobacteria bacterium]